MKISWNFCFSNIYNIHNKITYVDETFSRFIPFFPFLLVFPYSPFNFCCSSLFSTILLFVPIYSSFSYFWQLFFYSLFVYIYFSILATFQFLDFYAQNLFCSATREKFTDKITFCLGWPLFSPGCPLFSKANTVTESGWASLKLTSASS